MNLLELNDILLYGKKTTVKVPELNDDILSTFQKLINSGKKVRMFYDQTDDANSFFALFPDIKQIIGNKICVECFYACKCGYFMKGVPAKLLYIVIKMLSGENGKVFINRSMNGAIQLLKPYAKNEFESNGEKYTVKDIIENVAGISVKLINSSVRKVQVNDSWEVFIPDANRVAILPVGIGSILSMSDCENLTYKKNLGVVLNNVPIRTLGNRVGVTLDDFDLRNCF